MAVKTKPAVDLDLVKTQWISDVTSLIDQLEGWFRANKSATKVERSTVRIDEQKLGPYEVPALEADFGENYITVEPIGRNFPGRGIVQIQAWPYLRRVRLLTPDSPGEPWTVMTDSLIPLRQEWNQANFQTLSADLLRFE